VVSFVFKSGLLVSFIFVLCQKVTKCNYFCNYFVTFGQKKWANDQFFFKSGQQKTVDFQGFSGFLVRNPLFFIIKCEKKIIFLY